MTSLVFPDINVWLALGVSGHIHHRQAVLWYQQIDGEEMVFCRFTQLGLLRLLTTSAVMGREVMSQRQAWHIYDQFYDAGARLLPDPPTVEESMRRLTRHAIATPKLWADAYLAAFARESGATLITFDKALASMADAVLLH
jgi:toxin-antitoxin system PIN domain toxin